MNDIYDMTILLVEDNCDDEFLAIRTLRKIGFSRINVVRDGREAINVLLGDEVEGIKPTMEIPGLLLLDLRLPKLDGLEVLKKLREDSRTSGIPVIVLTSSEDPRDKEVCKELGTVALIPKPLSVETCKQCLKMINL